MAKEPLTGSRIRSFRIDRGIRQAELARACDISASYLNLIEHNRRRIGGALLVRIAGALDVDPGLLSAGIETGLASEIDAAAEARGMQVTQRARAEELAGRFPGWARLIAAQHREIRRLEQIIERLGDRMTHDPFLAASMHNVLSSVTAIRSASAILAKNEDIEPEWEARFHRNIFEDSQRLTEATEALVRYLDSDSAREAGATLPQDELDSWLQAEGWRIDALEADPEGDIDRIIEAAEPLVSASARELARSFLRRYAADVAEVPPAALRAEIGESVEPGHLAQRFGVGLPLIFRRLTTLGAEDLPDRQPFGLVACDAAGTLTFRKALPGFELPRYSAACALWPLFEALQRPMFPVTRVLTMTGRDEGRFETRAISELKYPLGIDGPAVAEGWMLFRPAPRSAQSTRRIGTSCRVCAEGDCVARREPSVFA